MIRNVYDSTFDLSQTEWARRVFDGDETIVTSYPPYKVIACYYLKDKGDESNIGINTRYLVVETTTEYLIICNFRDEEAVRGFPILAVAPTLEEAKTVCIVMNRLNGGKFQYGDPPT